MAKDKPGMMMYWEMFDMLENAEPEQVQALLRAMRRFSQDGELPDFGNDKALKFAWPMIEQKIIADSLRYEDIKQKRTEAGRKGGKARARNAKQMQANEANASNAKQIKPTSTASPSSTATSTSTATTAGASTAGAGNSPTRAYGCCKNVFLTEDEFDELCTDIPNAGNVIEKLSLHMKSSGKTYADHAATVRKWAMEDAERKQNAPASGGDWALSTNRTPYSDAWEHVIPELLED